MRDPRDCGSLVGACASRWLAGDHVSRGSPWGAWVAIADPWCFGSPMGLWWATLVCFDLNSELFRPFIFASSKYVITFFSY